MSNQSCGRKSRGPHRPTQPSKLLNSYRLHKYMWSINCTSLYNYFTLGHGFSICGFKITLFSYTSWLVIEVEQLFNVLYNEKFPSPQKWELSQTNTSMLKCFVGNILRCVLDRYTYSWISNDSDWRFFICWMSEDGSGCVNSYSGITDNSHCTI